ncbi:MAG: hypothetical protein HY706_12420 [Candidatus Hydrogenedentes bacterium]|nr:hypothetical protein [Candidatus Hydrogenedentota bacterium]
MTARAFIILALSWGVLNAAAEQYRYDAQGRLIKVVYDDGMSIAYTYDANGNLLQEKRASAATGDIDGDSEVNAVDVQLVINAALGINIGPLNADIDSSGNVDAVDVQLVINAALGIPINL